MALWVVCGVCVSHQSGWQTSGGGCCLLATAHSDQLWKPLPDGGGGGGGGGAILQHSIVCVATTYNVHV